MYIHVLKHGTDVHVRLAEPDDFRRFKILIDPQIDGHEARTALMGVAELADDSTGHVWIDAVRGMADRESDEVWTANFAQMLAYAERSGWTTRTGCIDAHCEWLTDRETEQ